MQGYKIICKQCGKSDNIKITQNNQIIWGKPEHIISARFRLDNQWGWECLCGNYDILTQQEKRQITNKQEPTSQEISEILKNLQPDTPKFEMVKA